VNRATSRRPSNSRTNALWGSLEPDVENRPVVLHLDEMTTPLPLRPVTQLEAAIGHYPGVVVIASHDRCVPRPWTGCRIDLSSRRHDRLSHNAAQDAAGPPVEGER